MMVKERFKVVPSVYLIPIHDHKTLLGCRTNTGWMDGHYGLVSGHVEAGETPEEAMIREAQEECGIILKSSSLILSSIMYRQVDRTNVDFFYTCQNWDGTIQNTEPDCCLGWEWFSFDQLPENTIDYLRIALNHAQKGKPLQLVNYQGIG